MAHLMSLGLIETVGLVAAVEAADAAVKSANVTLVGYELARGSGMATVKVEGDVGAVNAAVSAAKAAAAKVGRVVGTRVIARPSSYLETMVRNVDTVGAGIPAQAEEPEAETAEEPPAAPEASAAEAPNEEKKAAQPRGKRQNNIKKQ